MVCHTQGIRGPHLTSSAMLGEAAWRACSQQSLSPIRDCVMPMEPQIRCLSRQT